MYSTNFMVHGVMVRCSVSERFMPFWTHMVCFTFYLFVVKSVFCTQVLTALHRTTYCTELFPLPFLNIQTTLFALFENVFPLVASHHTVYLQITKIVQ